MTGRLEITRLRRRLDATLGRAPSTTADIEVQADFAKYFVILILGFLENCIVALLLDVAQRRSAPEIAFYVERQLDYWTNPNTERIIQLLGDFSPDWREAAFVHLVDERKAALNSLLSLRHKIAHGESVGTTLAQAKAYYITVLDVVAFLSDLIDPPQTRTSAL